MGPRERYVAEGSESFGDGDLLGLVLGTGTTGRSAAAVAGELLDRFGGLAGVARREVAELAGVHGVGVARAIRISAALELGRRGRAEAVPDAVVDGPEVAHRLLAPRLWALVAEELHGLFLDRRRRPIAMRRLTRGTESYTIVDARCVFRTAVGLGAHAVVLAHNHPSGDPTPSAQDLEVTDRVARAGRVLGVPLLDHLVVAGQSYTSLAREGALPAWREEPPSVLA